MKKFKDLENKLKELERKHKQDLSQDTFREIKNIRNKINSVATQEIKKKIMFLKQRNKRSKNRNDKKINKTKFKKLLKSSTQPYILKFLAAV